MMVTTSWIKPAPAVTGQDHLGTQAPCISLYAELLPGITNVTARARYYSFYPWLIWSYEQRYDERTADHLQQTLRRAECLFALIAARHEASRGEAPEHHGGAMVGRDELVPALAALSSGIQLRLSKYATLADKDPLRYFQNPLGGLGQYYFGPLRDTGVLAGETRSRQIRYTPERGLPLAETFDKGVDGAAFFALLDRDACTLADLDALAPFCPCGLKKNRAEQEALIEYFFDRSGRQGAEARPRRITLGLLLDLIDLGQRRDDTAFENEFRASTYTGALADGSEWRLPEPMESVRRQWAIYQRHELLSLATQALFWALLETAVRTRQTRAVDPSSLASLFGRPSLAGSLRLDTEIAFSEHVQRAHRSLPSLGSWTESAHEMESAWRVLDAARAGDVKTVLDGAVWILIALVARATGTDPYLGCSFPSTYFERYPINLRTMQARAASSWQRLSLGEVLRSFTVWAIETHFYVALQKLAGSPPRDTFKVRPFDGELRIIEAPPPGFTSPRIYRAMSMLKDLDLVLEDGSGQPSLTPLGQSILGAFRA